MYNQFNNKLTLILLILMLTALYACAGWNPDEVSNAEKEANEAVAEFKKHDPSMKTFFEKAYAYAVYPTVGKGAMGVGGAYGSGSVYEHGKLIGFTKMTQLTIGWQLGGQAYREIIFFENAKALDTFKKDSLEFSAQASAVAATAGAAANTNFQNNVAVFTIIKGGLMYEASIGGQSFTFEPLK